MLELNSASYTVARFPTQLPLRRKRSAQGGEGGYIAPTQLCTERWTLGRGGKRRGGIVQTGSGGAAMAVRTEIMFSALLCEIVRGRKEVSSPERTKRSDRYRLYGGGEGRVHRAMRASERRCTVVGTCVDTEVSVAASSKRRGGRGAKERATIALCGAPRPSCIIHGSGWHILPEKNKWRAGVHRNRR